MTCPVIVCAPQNDFSLCYRFFEEELAEACSPTNYNIGWGCGTANAPSCVGFGMPKKGSQGQAVD